MVSIKILPGPTNLRIAHAIAGDNPGAEVKESSSSITVQHPQRLVIRRRAVEEAAGQPLSTVTFHSLTFNRSGRIVELTSEQIVIEPAAESLTYLLRFRSDELRQKVFERADKLGISVAQLINAALESYLAE